MQKHIGQKAEQESVEDYLRTCGKCGKTVESDMPGNKKVNCRYEELTLKNP